jgi:putative DNA primase/helicase
VKFVAERFWQYGGGVWTDVPPLTAHQLVHDAMQTLAPLRELQTDKNVKAVVSLMKTEAARGMTLEVFDRHDRFLLNVRNGMLDVQRGTLTEHREDFYSTNQLPVEFRPGATCPLWLEWLAETQPDADIQAQIQEIFGYCLVPGNDYQKFFVFFGEGGSGKSTVLEVLKLLMGRHNTVPLPLLDLDEGFTRSMMVGRLLYDAGELTANSFKHIDLIKTISAGEEVLVEEKYKTPYSFRPQGKIVGTSNVFLKTPDGSMGLFRRLVQVPFMRPRPVESQRRNYHETFIAELPGIFVWAIEGYKRLLGRGYFAQSAAGAELSAAMSLHVNSVKTFLACCFEEREGGSTTADLIFADYREWCEFEAVNPYFKENIGLMREIYKHHPEWKKQQKFRRTDQGTIRTIAGVSERFGWRDKYGAELEQRPF